MRMPCAKTGMSRGWRAFTLVEALITSATLVIILGSVIMCNLFGLSMAARQQIWMGASDDAATAVGTLTEDIRSAVSLQVGTFTNGAFSQTPGSGQQSGNALLIYTNSAQTSWTLFYYSNNVSAYGVTNYLMLSNYFGLGMGGDNGLVSANEITNDVSHPIFTEVDYTGTPLSNSTPLAAISIYLSFTSLQNSQVVIAEGSQVDLYQIIAIVSPRLRL